MNTKRNHITKISAIFTGGLFVGVLFLQTSLAQQPVESGAGQICGILKSFQGDVQVFDYSRTHIGDAGFGTKLRCGDWVSVESGKAVIEHSNGSGILVSENSFIQVMDPQSGTNPEHAHIALYRGEFLLQASKAQTRVVTPNAIARVDKGGAYVIYSSTSEESQIVGMGGKATLENRFFPERAMTAEFAHIVTFSNPVERLVPEMGRPVNAKELNARLALIGVAPGVLETIEKAVRVATKTRMPVSLANSRKKGLEVPMTSPEKLTAPPAPVMAKSKPHGGAKRSLASVHVKKAVREEPNFKLVRPAQEEKDRKNLIQALSSIRPDEE